MNVIGALNNNFDKDKVQKELDVQREVTKLFGQNAPRVVADFSDNHLLVITQNPFWIKDNGWLKASLLEQGMILLDRNNQEVEVLSQFLIPNRLDTVYNIEVDDFHTYHVGRLGVWVHNADCCDLNVTPNGKTLPKGEPIFNTKDNNKTDARPYNIPDVPKVQTRHYTYANDRKVNGANVGDVFRTPDTHPDDFLSKGANKINKHTGEIWQKSHTSHTDKMGEWKIGINGKPPTRTKKITIGISDGKIIKIEK